MKNFIIFDLLQHYVRMSLPQPPRLLFYLFFNGLLPLFPLSCGLLLNSIIKEAYLLLLFTWLSGGHRLNDLGCWVLLGRLSCCKALGFLGGLWLLLLLFRCG